MVKVIGVRFRTAGKIYYFAPGDLEIKRGAHVIVETARGIEYGTVVGDVRQLTDDEVVQPLKPVLRIATERDAEQEKENKRKEKEAYRICLKKIHEHGLDMKLIDAEYTFDNNKVLFYFTSDGRVDFRELVKDLAGVFRTRIELRQVGVRDETKILGGIGICGRPLCCHTYLSEFIPVSIKMAKEQGLSLNPTKISGVCGRLMCCLKHEEETYEDLNKRLPNVGDTVTTPEGIRGEVHSVNVLRQKVKVLVTSGDEKEIKEYPVTELQFKKHYRREKLEVSEEELRLLRELENQDKQDSVENEDKPQKRKNKEKKKAFRNHDPELAGDSSADHHAQEKKNGKGAELTGELHEDMKELPTYMNPNSSGDAHNHSFRNKNERNRKGNFDKHKQQRTEGGENKPRKEHKKGSYHKGKKRKPEDGGSVGKHEE